MSRIYSNYNQGEIEAIEAQAKKFGMSISAFQRYSTLSMAEVPTKSVNMTALITDATNAIKQKGAGETFVVSSLLPAEVWTSMDRSQKQTISHTLKTFAEENPDIVVYTGECLKNKTKIYKKL